MNIREISVQYDSSLHHYYTLLYSFLIFLNVFMVSFPSTEQYFLEGNNLLKWS